MTGTQEHSDTNHLRSIVWITGASQGIGRSLALAMAKQGMTVIASARNKENLQQLVDDSSGFIGRIDSMPLDVTDAKAVALAVADIHKKYQRLDQAVLNAGSFIPMPGHDFKASIVARQMDLNVMSVAYCLENLIPIMRDQSKGVIAINASLSGYRGLPKAAAYGASKAALINMAECLELELQGSGIDVKVINPGFVKTPLTDKNDFPMPCLISSEKAAEHIIRGMGRKSFEITFPFVFAYLLKLLRILPYRLYFYLVRKATVDV